MSTQFGHPSHPAASPLGKPVAYAQHYAPELLFPIARQGKRDEIGIADGFQQEAVGVGQNHHAAGFADLLEHVFHDRATMGEEEAVAFLLRPQDSAR